MSKCDKCGPSKYSPEYNRRFKPENNAGCGSKNSPGCDSPSLAVEGSARWEWEQVHGKLVARMSRVLGEDGRWFTKIERIPCGPTSKRQKRSDCCALRYRVVR